MSWFGDLFTGPQAQSSGEAEANYARQRAELEKRLAERAAAGDLTPEQAAYYQSNTGDLLSTDQAAIEGLGEGAKEGAGNILNFATETLPNALNKTISGTLGAVFKALPWWLWIVGGLALFIWAGGLTWARGRMK